MNRLSNNIQFILAAFPFKSVEELAPIADSIAPIPYTIDLTPSLLIKIFKIIPPLHPNYCHFFLLYDHHQVRISLFQIEIRFLMVCVFTTKNMKLLPDTVFKAALILIAI